MKTKERIMNPDDTNYKKEQTFKIDHNETQKVN